MKKSLLKNLIALSFALGALVFIAGNLYADETETGELDPPAGYSCSVSVICDDGGSVSCTGVEKCERWSPFWVRCDGIETRC